MQLIGAEAVTLSFQKFWWLFNPERAKGQEVNQYCSQYWEEAVQISHKKMLRDRKSDLFWEMRNI